MVTLDDGALEAAAEYARTNKIQLSVHAMGDRAVGRIIDFFEDQTPWLEDRPSVRIEHATFLNEAQLARMNASAMRFGVTTQVIFPYAEIEGYRAVLAPKDLERVYPVRTVSSALDAFALSSDAPATAWADPDDPFVRWALRSRAQPGTAPSSTGPKPSPAKRPSRSTPPAR